MSLNDINNIAFILDGVKNGAYNLYLGAGATHGCINKHNQKFPLGDELKTILSKRYNKSARFLYQMATIIEPKDLNDTFQEVFALKNTSEAIKNLSNFVWKRIFTLNIDDAVENSYENNIYRKQKLISNNFKDTFYLESDLQKLQIIHLHGLIRKPSDGYVFNAKEYIENIKTNNTWLTVFSDLFSSESFIMSGLSLNEQDVNYYLSCRSSVTQKVGQYPSILIDPYPDDYTEKICEKHGFQLIQASFDDFIKYLSEEIKNVPTVYDLVNPTNKVFDNISEKEKIIFFNEFEFVEKNDNTTSQLSSFDLGFEPEMLDIFSEKDIHRSVTDKIINTIISKNKKTYGNLVLLSGKYLNGKSTTALRVLNYFLNKNYYIFRLKSLRGFNVENTINCLQELNGEGILYVDNIAEYIQQVNDILLKCPSIFVIGTERNYRIAHIKRVLEENINEFNCDSLSEDETERLIKKYLSLGKIQNRDVLNNKKLLINHTIGEQVCLILDSYEPIQNKISEYFALEPHQKDLDALLYVGICCYCYKLGINYYIIRSLLPNSYNLNKLFKTESPFKLEFNRDDKDYVLPRNKLYFAQLIEYYLKKDINLVRECYIKIVKKISSSVNRKTIMLRTPESKLLARMLDIDKNVRHFFQNNEQYFMESIKNMCEWNSRYWEQWALSLISTDIDRALSYAKTAVSLELHPYPLTTLSKILFAKMNSVEKNEKTDYCIEALTECLNAMTEEGEKNLQTIHPLLNIINGLNSYRYVFHDNNLLPNDLRHNIYAAIDTYEQELSLSRNEKESINTIKEYLL